MVSQVDDYGLIVTDITIVELFLLTTVGSFLILSKSRGAGIGSNTIVQNGDLILFAKDLFKYDFTSNENYVKHYDTLKKKYKLCPNKPTLNKIYTKLLKRGEIDENTSFLKYSLKKKVRSDSGVSVITILT